MLLTRASGTTGAYGWFKSTGASNTRLPVLLLEPNTAYDVRVRARSALATGLWSDTARAMTNPLSGTNRPRVTLYLNGVTKVKEVPGVTATLTIDSTVVEEGDETTATITVVTDGPKEPHAFMGNLLIRAEAGTAGENDFQVQGVNNASIGVNSLGFDPVESGGVITSYQRSLRQPQGIADGECGSDGVA